MADELLTSSSLKVPYNLRPSKQAERRMLLDLYQSLMGAGFPLPQYHYVGFGSIFFVDFRILHKILGLEKMTSIEGFKSLIPRCKNNLPFNNVELFEGLSSDYIPLMNRDELYLAWFDYDFTLGKIVADDIAGLAATVRPWSLLFITIDLERPSELEDDKPDSFLKYFEDGLPEFARAGLTRDDFKPPNREATIIRMVERCFEQGLRGRSGLSFEYLVRLTYADGHRMLTIGGMLADGPARAKLSVEALGELWFLSRERSAEALHIPRMVFTQKEVAALEQCVPNGGKIPKALGIEKSDFDDFAKFYRYWPSYSESLV